jgi:hypothetical protein
MVDRRQAREVKEYPLHIVPVVAQNLEMKECDNEHEVERAVVEHSKCFRSRNRRGCHHYAGLYQLLYLDVAGNSVLCKGQKA